MDQENNKLCTILTYIYLSVINPVVGFVLAISFIILATIAKDSNIVWLAWTEYVVIGAIVIIISVLAFIVLLFFLNNLITYMSDRYRKNFDRIYNKCIRKDK